MYLFSSSVSTVRDLLRVSPIIRVMDALNIQILLRQEIGSRSSLRNLRPLPMKSQHIVLLQRILFGSDCPEADLVRSKLRGVR